MHYRQEPLPSFLLCACPFSLRSSLSSYENPHPVESEETHYIER